MRALFQSRMVRSVLLAAIAVAAVEGLFRVGRVAGTETFFYDLWHNLAGKQADAEHAAIVAIDNDTLLEHKDEPLVFWGPLFARAIEVLRKVGARVVGLDYLFAVSAESWLKRLELSESEVSRTYDISMREQLGSGQVVLIGIVATDEKGKTDILLPIEDYLFALPNGAEDVGLANLYTDEDGVVRRFVPAVFEAGSAPNLTFPALLAVRAVGLNPADGKWQIAGREVLNATAPLPIGFAGPPGTIRPVSFSRLLLPEAEQDPEVQRLKGKIVIVAADHVGAQDIHLTPYAQGFMGMEGRMMSGAELNANIVETLLSGRFPEPVPQWARILYLALVAVLGSALFFQLHPLRGVGAGFLVALGVAGLAYLLFLEQLIIPVASAYMALVLCYLGTLGIRLTGEERERRRLRSMFGQYVSDEVVEKLLASGRRPNLGGETLQITVLFSDIRNFTTISERLDAHEVVEMLNTYFGRVCGVILEQGGTINKFIGDAVMAIFGSPVACDDQARRALGTALKMAETAKEFRSWMAERFAGRELPEFNIGVGIHTGKAVVGNIGSQKRMEFTAIGDTVNIASRLEGITKQLGVMIVVSEAVVAAAGSGVRTGKQEQVKVKGKEKPLNVFEFVGFESAPIHRLCR